MDSYGLQWILTNYYEFLRITMNFYGFLKIINNSKKKTILNSYELLWIRNDY